MFYQPQIDRLELPLARLPAAFDGMTVLHLSDLHVTRWTRRLRQWWDALAGLQPDLLVITGDLGHRSWLWRTAFPNVVRLLDAVRPRVGCYFILGNHDSPNFGPALAETGRVFLENDAVVLERGQQRLVLVGLKQHRRIDTDFPAALRGVSAADCKIVLMHYPDFIHHAAAVHADLCLAGHTHGGQICYPTGRPIIRHDVLPQDMCTGIHKVNGTWMVVNRGVGVAGVRVRLFCPPQAILLTLRCARSAQSPPVAHREGA